MVKDVAELNEKQKLAYDSGQEFKELVTQQL